MKKSKEEQLSSRIDALNKKIGRYNDKVEEQVKEVKRKNSRLTAERIIFELFGGILFGVFAGFLVDDYFNSTPIFLLIFLILGLAGSFYNIYKISLSESNDSNKDKEE
jgi:F0F1-type ATP synthase assembly protein I